MKKRIIFAFIGWQLVLPQPWAQDTANTASSTVPETQAVVVSGLRDPEWKSYPAMLKGVAAFAEHHQIAPKADLRFAIIPQTAATNLIGITLRIDGKDAAIPIPVAEDGTFSLPHDAKAAEENAELIVNRKKGTLRWRPNVRTPQLPQNTRRLGDLRLECEVRWAVEKDDMSFFDRNAMRLLGGMCSSAGVHVAFATPYPTLTATIISGAQREVVRVGKHRNSFIPPLHDRKWPDDALIEFEQAHAEVGDNQTAPIAK